MVHDELIKKMTLEEKASLTSGKNFWETMNIPHLGIKSMFLSDGPHGIRKQAAAADHLGLNKSLPATCFPTSATIANSFNVELAEKVGKALGEEALALDVNVVLGPGLNIKRNPRCGRNFEYYSEDPYLAGKIAASYVKGIQSNGIASCIKHYACNNQEERRLTSNSVLDERTLREIYTTAFEIVIKEAKPLCVMSAYNLVNDVYANENKHLLKEILRDDFGFNGVVITDWGGDNDRVAGLVAGNELEMPANNGETDVEIVNAIKNHKIDESVLDESVDRLLTLHDTTFKPFEGGKKYKIDIQAHHEIAKEAARESIVLLKNENNALPLNSTEKVAIIGDFAKNPRYQGAGSSIVNPTKLDNTLELIKDFDINYVGYEQGFNRYGKEKKTLFEKAIGLARNVDTVIFYMGLDEVTEAEGLDRDNIKIHKNQVSLLKAIKELGKKVIVILSEGSVVELDFEKYADAILFNCLNGQAGSGATLEILTGEVNPSGRLSETYPLTYGDTPTEKYFPAHDFNSFYKDAIYVGYRYFDKLNKKVRYPFGYGLSYTTFEYSDLEITPEGVKFKLTNSGKVKGKEVPQLYIGLNNSKVFRAKKELKGFTKVELNPGETKEVTLDFDEYSFRFFNVKDNKFEIEKGTYSIYVGSNVEDIKLTGELDVDGVVLNDDIYDQTKLSKYYSGEISNVSDEEFEALLGRKLPTSNVKFVKKNRILVDYNTSVIELKYAKGWTGRLFSGAIRFAIKFLECIGSKDKANVLIMGVINQPMRSISRMTNGAITMGQLNGLILMFNGHFFKGFKKFIKEGSKKPKISKENRYRLAAKK